MGLAGTSHRYSNRHGYCGTPAKYLWVLNGSQPYKGKEVIKMDEALMVPLFLDFAIEVPEDMEIEQNAGQDCVTWGESPCDDD